jgi:hypothetical protein
VTTIKIKVEDELLAAIDKRCEMSGLSRERLTYFDTKYANLRFLQGALDYMDGNGDAV